MAVSGFARPPSLVDVPHYVRAKSPEGLIRAMLANNVKLKAYVGYFDIQFVNGFWYAWFTVDIEKGVK
jgi:hypothetical protein